jgi:hypothetical protein
MTCKALLMRMSRYIDGDLEEELCAELRGHLPEELVPILADRSEKQ